ncbi:hypothetical protein [uncultured Maribacter sp.]|uniref:hypothetical protein n=1 Tax=uncultured Maribacter sp. TaxID=431308 RepID=UPI0030D80D73
MSSISIIDYPELTSGSFKRRSSLGRPNSSTFNQNGYSDHLPIKMVLIEKDLAA